MNLGSCLFCRTCGNLLGNSSSSYLSSHHQPSILCDSCGSLNPDISHRSIVSESNPSAFPSVLRTHHLPSSSITLSSTNVNAFTQQTCERCGREEVRYFTLQLRSADEGSTVFYECECGHKWNTNN